jgi:vacuolar-type H+-ATPase subunit B/Vma2
LFDIDLIIKLPKQLNRLISHRINTMDKLKAAVQDKLLGFDHAKGHHEELYADNVEPHHKAKFGHELVAGGAAFEAMRMFEKHQRKNGSSSASSFFLHKHMGLTL